MKFNIFNKKPESRLPEYKKVSSQLEEDKASRSYIHSSIRQSPMFLGLINSITSADTLKKLEKNIKNAEKVLENIFDKDRNEAIKLNKEYESLMEEISKSGDLPKLYKFETDKLGMHKEIEGVLNTEVEKANK